ncbi:50S ribosomal protein L17 [Poriferisphaera sp. WC338]|uniref:50S ribosomal protein L17 n=1 Tax=Poriferisphaera sp. WC338 TaxID=3425129 RepID=UPI003D8133BA
MAGRKLGRNTAHRKALWRNMAVSLFTHGQITTTLPKAKSLKPFVEKLITAAKKGDLASRRRVIAALGTNRILIRGDDDENIERNKYGEITKAMRSRAPKVVQHLFDEIAPKFADRNGGYTRIIKLGKHRIGDAADLCVLQIISDEDTGPQVSGQSSRRREKANRRMERAAAARKGAAVEEAPAEEVVAEVEAEVEAPEATDEEKAE